MAVLEMGSSLQSMVLSWLPGMKLHQKAHLCLLPFVYRYPLGRSGIPQKSPGDVSPPIEKHNNETNSLKFAP